MFAQREHFDVFDHDHFVVIFVEHSLLDSMFNAVVVPLKKVQTGKYYNHGGASSLSRITFNMKIALGNQILMN